MPGCSEKEATYAGLFKEIVQTGKDTKMFCKQSFSLPSEPSTLLQLTESGASPTAHEQGLQRWQVCSLCHPSAVGTERPLKIGVCKMCLNKTGQIAKESYKRL